MTTYSQLNDDYLNAYVHGNYAKAEVYAETMIHYDVTDYQGYINLADATTQLGQLDFANDLRQVAMILENRFNERKVMSL